MTDATTDRMQTCPRRYEIFQRGGDPNQDTWDERSGHRFCSYCGSLHPDEFMLAVRNGLEVMPTDKSYKAYLKIPDRIQTKFYYAHLSPEQQQEFLDLANSGKMLVGYPGRFYSGVYLPALFTEQKDA